MWFTRVSIANPVLATMVMLAFMVLGLFSYQRLKVDQFPDVEFPVVVVQVDYPGASPEIVENEVTRKVEEAVNAIAGINKLYSRSFDGSSLVIIEFDLDVDDRRAAEDVREKMSALRPTLRDEVEEPRVLRFDPASRPVYILALTSPDDSRSAIELSATPSGAPELIAAHLREVESRIAKIPPATVTPWAQLRSPIVLGAVLSGVTALALTLASDRATAGAFALLHPGARDVGGVHLADVVTDVRAELAFPTYLARDAETSDEPTTLTAPRGTTVHWSARARLPLSRATLDVAGARVPLELDGDRRSARFVVRESGALRVDVRDD